MPAPAEKQLWPDSQNINAEGAMPGEGLKVQHRATVGYFQVLTFPPQDVFDTSDIGAPSPLRNR